MSALGGATVYLLVALIANACLESVRVSPYQPPSIPRDQSGTPRPGPACLDMLQLGPHTFLSSSSIHDVLGVNPRVNPHHFPSFLTNPTHPRLYIVQDRRRAPALIAELTQSTGFRSFIIGVNHTDGAYLVRTGRTAVSAPAFV